MRLREKRGSSLVETTVGSIFIVMVALFLLDVASIVICQTQNDALAKHCARAASNQPTQPEAKAAVDDVVAEFKASGGGSKICLFDKYSMNYTNAQVLVTTQVTCNFPVPIPFGPAYMQFASEATEPVVADVVPPS